MAELAYVSAKTRYEALKTGRKDAETRAKRCAKVTLPKLYQEFGTKAAGDRKTPQQSAGPRCVNALGSRLLMAMFPANASAFKLSPDNAVMKQIAEQAGMQQGDVELALADVERTVMNDMETSGMRGSLSMALIHAVGTGNVALYVPDVGPLKVYPLTRYVCDRDGLGTALEMIFVDKVALSTLAPATLIACGLPVTPSLGNEADEKIIYTRVVRDSVNEKWLVSQELNDKLVPDSEGDYPLDSCPWVIVAIPRTEGEDYGTGLVFDYIGDFESLEKLRQALLKGAAAAAKILWALNPNSAINPKTITEAESGAVLRFNASDLTSVGLDKYSDMMFVSTTAREIADGLELAFGVRTAIQRSGERVTAEEIRYLAQALDEALGGIYSILTEELMLPLVMRELYRLEKQGRLPPLPKGVLKPRITVGTAALGRGQDLNKLIDFATAAKTVLGEKVFAERVSVGEWLSRIGAAGDISVKGLVKTDAEVQAATQQTTMNDAAVRAAPQVAQAVAEAAVPE